jgi:catechol 2,3-dioxygenase-like lactoylglutathione lyase family enzyme
MSDPVISGDDVFSHACLGASDLAASVAFYDATLAPLGIKTWPFGETVVLYVARPSRLFWCSSRAMAKHPRAMV